ncbi:unnamed protein product [Orchesella dallaii]|uniref:Protein FAM166B n=1 Tax=Orchesella dallaii TaxID=48710 RepID=A0ABP1QCY5_9HEXA
MEDFHSNYEKYPLDTCLVGHRYSHKYPRSFDLRPRRGTPPPVHSTLHTRDLIYSALPPHPVINNYWSTTNGLVHGRKFQDPLVMYPVLSKAPAAGNMNYMFPDIEKKMQTTYAGLNYNPNVGTGRSVTKTEFGPKRPIADFDYLGSPYLVTVNPPRAIRIPIKGQKPGYFNDEQFSILRKFNPYLSHTKIDFCAPKGPLEHPEMYGVCRC